MTKFHELPEQPSYLENYLSLGLETAYEDDE